MRKNKPICANCHFLVKAPMYYLPSGDVDVKRNEISFDDRKVIRKGDAYSWLGERNITCANGFWGESDSKKVNLKKTLVKTIRKDCCFFPFRSGVSWDGALALYNSKEAKNIKILTWISIFISVVGVVIGVISLF